MKKGIIFIICGRLNYFSETLDKWNNVKNINKFDFYFRLEPHEQNHDIVDLIKTFCKKNNLVENITINKEKNGMSKNHHNALYQMFDENNYDFVVLAEDDIVPSNDLIDYFDYFSENNDLINDENIIAVCANNHNGLLPSYNIDNSNIYFKKPNFNAWLWGTWKNKWDKHFKNKIVCCMNSSCEHLIWKDHGNSWESPIDAATQIDKICKENNLLCITPESSRSQHIGRTGYHYDEDYFPFSQVPFKFEHQWDKMTISDLV